MNPNDQHHAAEKSILGTILVYPHAIEQVVGTLAPEDFTATAHRKIYQIACKLHREGFTVTPIHLLDSGIDALEVSGLSEYCRSPELITHFAKLIRDRAARGRLRAICERAAVDAAALHGPELGELVSRALREIEGCWVEDMAVECERELVAEIVTACEQRSKQESEAAPLGVTTGLRTLDNALVYGGLARGHVTTVAAKTSQGKSALSQAFKRGAARQGARVLVVTIEDSSRAQVRRDLSAESGIQNRQVQRQVIGWDEWQTFVGAASKIHRYGDKIHYIDTPPDNVHEMLSTATRHMQTAGADLVIIDYLQLVPSGQAYSKEQQHVDYVFSQIVKFSRKHKDVATLLVTQMARHDGRPRLEKLYHSAKLEQGSHTVMMIWAPELKGWPRPQGGIPGNDLVECRIVDIAKQKDGPTGLQALGWDGKTVRFYEPNSADAKAYLADVSKVK